MAKPQAYSETHRRNISLDEAHRLYFSQAGTKARFVFRCGDSRCRSQLNPLVAAALYDRLDIPGEMHYSPYFKSLKKHPHIENCTWIEKIKTSSNPSIPHNTSSTGWAVSTNGLIFDPAPRDPDHVGISEPTNRRNPSNGERPQSSRFMRVVAERYVNYTEHQRKSIPLKIGKEISGSFYTVCRPLSTFHPFYQSKTIYFGYVEIINLTYTFLIKFHKKMSPKGVKEQRNIEGQITLQKNKLEAEDFPLLEILNNFNNDDQKMCFFYSTIPPITKDITGTPVARFEIDNFSHIAVTSIPNSTSHSNS